MNMSENQNANNQTDQPGSPAEEKKTYFGMKVLFKKAVVLIPVKLEKKSNHPFVH